MAPVMFVAAVLIIYLIPSFIANNNEKRGLAAIIAFNVLLGWTLVGWVMALVWATSDDHPSGMLPGPPRRLIEVKAIVDPVSALERLAKLHDSGHLSAAEFAAQKAAIIRRPVAVVAPRSVGKPI